MDSPYFSLLALGLAIGCAWFVWAGERRGLPRVVLIDVCLAAVIGGVAGGRLLHVVAEPLPGYAVGPEARAVLAERAAGLDPPGRAAVEAALAERPVSAAWAFIARMPPGTAREQAIAAARADPAAVPARLWYAARPLEALQFWKGGMAYLGGLVLATALAVAVVRRHGARVAEVADVVAPAIALGLAFGRLGCFLGGCCYGEVCAPAWWATPPPWYGPPVGGVPRYPTALLSAAWAAALFAALWWLLRRRRAAGEVFLALWVLYAPGRFAIEALRADPRGGLLGLSTSQLGVLLTALPAAAGWLWLRRRAPGPEVGSTAQPGRLSSSIEGAVSEGSSGADS